MPRYAFEDTKTGEQFEMDMSYDELTPFLNHHPELQQVFKIMILTNGHLKTMLLAQILSVARRHPKGLLWLVHVAEMSFNK
jgi:hypothetical protein